MFDECCVNVKESESLCMPSTTTWPTSNGSQSIETVKHDTNLNERRSWVVGDEEWFKLDFILKCPTNFSKIIFFVPLTLTKSIFFGDNLLNPNHKKTILLTCPYENIEFFGKYSL